MTGLIGTIFRDVSRLAKADKNSICIVPAPDLETTTELLSSQISFSNLGFSVSLEDLDSARMIRNFDVSNVYFHIIDENKLVDYASSVCLLMNSFPNINFSLVCDDISTWLRFFELCNCPNRLFVCPILTLDIQELHSWITMHLSSVIVIKSLFDEKFSIYNEYLPFISHFFQRNIPLLVMSDMDDFQEVQKALVAYSKSHIVSFDLNLSKPYDPFSGFAFFNFFGKRFGVAQFNQKSIISVLN